MAIIDQVSHSQYSKEVTINAGFDAVGPAACYGPREGTSDGLTFGVYGGSVRIAGALTVISSATVSLSASTTNYIQAHPDTGAISVNTTGFTAGYLPMFEVVTGTATVTTATDKRASYVLNDTLALALSDANTTLTQAQSANAVLTFTGTLTVTRDIIVPLVGKRQWTVYNGTGQSLRFIGASGTGITVATVKHAIVRSDGTNIVRVMADT